MHNLPNQLPPLRVYCGADHWGFAAGNQRSVMDYILKLTFLTLQRSTRGWGRDERKQEKEREKEEKKKKKRWECEDKAAVWPVSQQLDTTAANGVTSFLPLLSEGVCLHEAYSLSRKESSCQRVQMCVCLSHYHHIDWGHKATQELQVDREGAHTHAHTHIQYSTVEIHSITHTPLIPPV